MKKIARQPSAAISAPPTSGPLESATDAPAAQSPTARERQKRRRERARNAPPAPADEQPRPGGGSLDIRA